MGIIKTGHGLLAIMKKKPASVYTVFSIENIEKSLNTISEKEEKVRKESQEAAKKNLNFFIHLPTKEVFENFTGDERWLLFLLCRQASKGVIYTGHKGADTLEKASFYIDDNLDVKDSFFTYTIEIILETCDNINQNSKTYEKNKMDCGSKE